jgi:peroxin-6
VAFPIEKIILKLSSESAASETIVKKTVLSLVQNADQNLTIFQKDFRFLYQRPSNKKEDIPPLLIFDVVGITPTLQGRLTSSTDVRLITFPSQTSSNPDVSNTTGGVSLGHDLLPEDDDTFEDDIVIKPPTIPRTKQRSVSLSSASDFRLEDSGMYDNAGGSDIPPTSLDHSILNPRLILKAHPVSGMTIPFHFIIIPKKQAQNYNMFDLHHVIVKTFTGDHPQSSRNHGNDDIIVPLNNELRRQKGNMLRRNSLIGCSERQHLAVIRLYDNALELEMFIEQFRLNVPYQCSDFDTAYLHPELFFYLFPKTLSIAPRKYFIEIENLMTTPTSAREFKTHPLAVPQPLGWTDRYASSVQVGLIQSLDQPPDVKELLFHHLQTHTNKLVVNTGAVFSLMTDHGRMLLRVIKLEPESLENGGLINEKIQYCGRSHSFIPYLVSPSHLNPVTSYWEELRPPGLAHYCKTLFDHFISKIAPVDRYSVSSHCTIALVTGPPGVGKRTVVRAVARQCRMHVVEFNCYEIINEAAGVTETKLRCAFDEAVKMAPCVMILNDINVMTMSGSPTAPVNEEEPRIVAAFERYITSINEETKSSHFPVLVVGVAVNARNVSSSIQQYFLHEIVMTPPTLEERLDMINGFARYVSLDVGIDTTDVAQSTAGFVLGDYVTLFKESQELAMTDIIKTNDLSVIYDEGADANVQWVTLQNIAIAGVLVTERSLNQALDRIRSLHSSYVGTAKIPKVKWEDVGGLETAKKEILETIQLPLMHPELFAGGLHRSGILLYGPPGTGKTLLAKAVATECKLNFISIKGPELINMYVGQTEENIREVFARARGAAPCVIFFDELDSIAPNRGKSGDSGGVMDRVVSQILAELNGMDKFKNVFVIGATNRPDLIDPALLRPGRFDRLVYLDVCDDWQSKFIILKAITRKFDLHEDVDLSVIARSCPPNVTGADLYSLCADAMLATLRKHVHQLESHEEGDREWDGSLQVCQDEFLSALDKLTPSVTKEELDNYRNKKSFTNI